jgi:ankyrin repeat protein
MAAITSQPPQVIDTLLHAGADANLHTPLAEIGSRKDAVAIATVLFKYNAKVNQLSSQNETPLMNATAYENVELARFLLAKGARVNQQNSDGQTALCFAYSGTAVAKLLQANGGHRANCPAN